MNRSKRGLLVSVGLILVGLGYLIFGNFGANLVYFATPSEVLAFTPDRYGKTVRVGGMVVKGSLKTKPATLKMTFDLTDGVGTIPVAFEGVPPDLFKEGQGAVVEGHWSDARTFYARTIMAKHSEDYMPIEMKALGLSLPKKDLFKTLQTD